MIGVPHGARADGAIGPVRFVDFHTHLHWYPSIGHALDEAERLGIVSVACSVDAVSFALTREASLGRPLAVPTFGIHPARAADARDPEVTRACLADSPIVGEIGLDSVWFSDVPMAEQSRAFEEALDHCHLRGKACVIHTKGEEARVADALASFPKARPVIHWYSGARREFDRLADLGCLFTFGTAITRSATLREYCAALPWDRILSETDNPTAERWLGGAGDGPDLVLDAVAGIAWAKGASFGEARAAIAANSARLLDAAGYSALAGALRLGEGSECREASVP